MASYLDNPELLGKFNPYIPQIPTETLTAVGMELQRRYDTGVEKIQSSIDRIAGLDIIRDVDKNYLHSKLNELGTKLKTVAAGDFSNYQLTNHVAGMAGGIGKDNNVINAVTSTARVRSGQRDLETAKKEGKSSVQNEDWWNIQVGQYLNNRDLKTSFNGEYVPYSDLTEKYAKVAKDVEAIEYTYDMPYITDEKGNPRYFIKDKKGQLIETPPEKGGTIQVDDAMRTITRKGKSAQTILNNFMDNTTENDRRQLQIDAAYHYKNATIDNFKGDIKNVFDLQKKQLEEYSTELGVQLKNPKIPDKDKASIQAKLNDINATLSSGKIDSEMMKYMEELKNPANLEAFKTKLYTQKYLTNLAQDKSTESYIMSIKDNPYTQMDMTKKKFLFEIEKENTRIQEKNRDYKFEYLKWVTDRQDKNVGKEPIVVSGGVEVEGTPPTGFNVDLEIEKLTSQLKTQNNDFLSKNKKYTKAQLNEFASKYDGNPASVDTKDNNLREYLRERRDVETSLLRAGSTKRKLAEITASVDSKLIETFNSTSGIYDNTGRQIYSSKELYDFWYDRESFISQEGSGGYGTSRMKFDTEGLINKYKGTKYEMLAIASANVWNNKPSAVDKELEKKGASIYLTLGPVVGDNANKKRNLESEYLTTKTHKYMTKEATLSRENKVDRDIADQLISNSIGNPLGMVDVERKSEFKPEVISSWRKDAKIRENLDYRIIKNYDGSGTFIIQNGKEIQKIPLTAKGLNAYYPQYSGISPVDAIKDAISTSPELTTNPVAQGEPTTAAYTGYGIPSLRDTNWASRVRFDVEGYYKNIGNEDDGYQIRVYVCDDNGLWHQDTINQTGFIKEGRILEAIDSIGMDIVMQILKK
jgi:hypothetical protein